jgi:cob(I)alamin adenosyltransferase
MSIITKRGDSGETDLLFSRRICKTSQRVAAMGVMDELNAALGLASPSHRPRVALAVALASPSLSPPWTPPSVSPSPSLGVCQIS